MLDMGQKKGARGMRHRTEKRLWGLALCFAAALSAGPILAGELYIYPNKGQSQEQQSRDRYECHVWAVQQTGYDPTSAQVTQAPPPFPPRGGALKGAAGGAALGAIGGAIGGDVGKGAAIGAATGGVFGGMRQRQQTTQHQQAQAQQTAQQSAAANNYQRALSACLSGRGYTVQ
jgi:YMGG-like Gly-zipper